MQSRVPTAAAAATAAATVTEEHLSAQSQSYLITQLASGTRPRFTLNYSKSSNRKLFSAFDSKDKKNLLNITQPQNYIPFYQRFFALSPTNAVSVNLNQRYSLKSVLAPLGGPGPGENAYRAAVETATPAEKHAKKEVNIFFKYSPLLDPLKYMAGKYDTTDPELMALPTFPPDGKLSASNKMHNVNNMSYVDAFFTYLCSQLLHHHSFTNGLDFYGSFLAMKSNFAVNLYDDIEFLQESKFFMDNVNILFQFDDPSAASTLLNHDTRNKKHRLIMAPETTSDITLNLSDIKDLEELDTLFAQPNEGTLPAANPIEAIYTKHSVPHSDKSSKSSSSSSNCSSRTSNTNLSETAAEYEQAEEAVIAAGLLSLTSNDTPDDMKDDQKQPHDEDAADADNKEDEDEEDEDDDDEDDDGELIGRIHIFPVQVIALECCEGTLDSLLVEKGTGITETEWSSIIIQVLMSLITFQKCFDLTHNDLHTNNIMYITTKEKFLYYKVNDVYYKVPTFGRIYKIIDFGRAIYRFQGQLMCSDSFSADGDAYSQYNSEPFYNAAKPRIDPNPSFDLCRLGCALFDFLVDDLDQLPALRQSSAIKNVMLDWCTDDQGRNVLYKSNGDERYPEFKLYKMIARTVHHHTPMHVLQNHCFQQFHTTAKKLKGLKGVADAIINIDAFPSYQ